MPRKRLPPTRPIVPPWWRIDAAHRSPYRSLRIPPTVVSAVWDELGTIAEHDPASLRVVLDGLHGRAEQARAVATTTDWPHETGFTLVHTMEAATEIAAAVEQLPRPPEGLIAATVPGDLRWTVYLVLMIAGTMRALAENPDEPCVDPVREPHLVPALRALPPLERMFIPAFRAMVEVARATGALDEAAARLIGRTPGHRASALAITALGLLDTAVTRTGLAHIPLAPFEAIEQLLRMRSTVLTVRHAASYLDRQHHDVAGPIADALARRWDHADPLEALAEALDARLGFAPKLAGNTAVDEARRHARMRRREIPGLGIEDKRASLDVWLRSRAEERDTARTQDLATFAAADPVLRRALEVGAQQALTSIEEVAAALGLSRDTIERRRRRVKPE